MTEYWLVGLSKKARKQYEALRRCGQKKPSILDAIDALVMELKLHGPTASWWPNYGLIHTKEGFYYHCHLKKGHPTYVACWEVRDKKSKIIEVFYVGTHEDAPY